MRRFFCPSRHVANALSKNPPHSLSHRAFRTTCQRAVKHTPFQSLPSPSWLRRADTTATADTIYALSSAPGRAAISVIRVTGPACLDIYGGLCPNRPFPSPRVATLRTLYDPDIEPAGQPVVLENSALVLYFPAPKTVTGEDVIEFHVHGGAALVKSVLDAIPRCTGSRSRKRAGEHSHIRHAEAGEFTKRAFYNGRLDLTQAESLGDILAAETEQQRRLAIGGDGNTLAKRYEEWRKMLLYARGEMEALIDFSEDQHFDESPTQLVASVTKQVYALHRRIQLHLRNAAKGELLRSGISVALLGAPNAGKSSLLNRVVGREAAIVSAEEGTTRDIIDVNVDIGGWLVRLGDLAGLRSKAATVGSVETEGIRRAMARALDSAVVVALFSIEMAEQGKPALVVHEQVVEAVHECVEAGKQVVIALNKVDLIPTQTRREVLLDRLRAVFPTLPRSRFVCTSCTEVSSTESHPEDEEPVDIQSLLAALVTTFQEMTQVDTPEDDTVPGSASVKISSLTESQAYWTASLSISARQSAYLQECRRHLSDFLRQADPSRAAPTESSSTVLSTSEHYTDNHDDIVGEVHGDDMVIEPDIVALAEDLRFAADYLARITGRGEAIAGGDVEDVLGVVFEKFCVGK